MKTLLSITLCSTLISVSLNARENPFVPTTSFEEESARLIELNENNSPVNEEQYIKEMQKAMENVGKPTMPKKIQVKPVKKMQVKKPEKIYTQKEVKKLIKKAQKQTEYKTKKLIKKELDKIKEKEPEQIIYVKPRTDVKMPKTNMIMKVKKDSKMTMLKLLPYLSASYNDEKITLDSKSKVLLTFALNDKNKIIVDYKDKVSFYTKREKLSAKNFKKLSIGNHPTKGFYRVVIELDSMPTNYMIEQNKQTVTITKK